MFKILNKKGFTIIELLVVISIISALSSIVIASVAGVRRKAEDSYMRSNVQSYALAFHMYYDDHGFFPPTEALDDQFYCLGKGPCSVGDTVYFESPSFISAISPYIPSASSIGKYIRPIYFEDDDVTVDYQGGIYRCHKLELTDTTCNVIYFGWATSDESGNSCTIPTASLRGTSKSSVCGDGGCFCEALFCPENSYALPNFNCANSGQVN